MEENTPVPWQEPGDTAPPATAPSANVPPAKGGVSARP